MATRKKTEVGTKRKRSPLSAARGAVSGILKDDDSYVEVDESKLKESLPHLPSGSIVIDWLIGGRANRWGVMPCPGFPRGKIVNLYGQEAAGKTTMALEVANKTIENGGYVGFVDWEHAVDLSYASALGIPVQNEDVFNLVQPVSLERGLTVITAMARAGVDLIVIDSVGAGVPQAILNQTLDEKGNVGRVGLIAQIWSHFLRELQSTISRSGSCVIGISQLRKAINTTGYGGPTNTQQGGEAWKFYSSLRFGLRRIKYEKGKIYDPLTHKKIDAVIASTIRAKIDKCKISASQGHEADFFVRFGEGIDDMKSVIEIAKAHGIIKGSSWLSWERGSGETLKIQGMERFKEALRAADGAVDELSRQVMDALTVAGPGTIVAAEDEDLDVDSILTGVREAADDEAN
jgi:recombination protein RecA